MRDVQDEKRPWRAILDNFGQGSDLFLAEWVLDEIAGDSIVDVGCGSGVPTSIIRGNWFRTKSWNQRRALPTAIVGIDFSPTAVSKSSKYGAFDEVREASAAQLPAADKEFEVAISIENLEHLYRDEVLSALKELARVSSRQILITTPWPWDVCNVGWLKMELEQAKNDQVFLSASEFRVLEGAVHKSTLFPQQLIDAGFKVLTVGGTTGRNGFYEGWVSELDLEKLGNISGMEHPTMALASSDGDYRAVYVDLIEKALAWAPAVEELPRRVAFSRKSRASGMSIWYGVGRVVAKAEGRFKNLRP
jgi:ubiquinone/menaquinone biosynthesis C-methylase UbiE